MKLCLLIMGVGFLLQAAEVEVDIFSGRPNPAWKLSQEEASQLLGMLENLPATESRTDAGKLGYRGFVVSFKDSQGQLTRIRIHEGMVARSVGDSTDFFMDKDRTLERWLLKNSASRLSPDLYDVVAKEIS